MFALPSDHKMARSSDGIDRALAAKRQPIDRQFHFDDANGHFYSRNGDKLSRSPEVCPQ